MVYAERTKLVVRKAKVFAEGFLDRCMRRKKKKKKGTGVCIGGGGEKGRGMQRRMKALRVTHRDIQMRNGGGGGGQKVHGDRQE